MLTVIDKDGHVGVRHEDEKLYTYKKGIILMSAILILRHMLDKNEEIANSTESQLIKVIEYNVINKKKKMLTVEEKKKMTDKIAVYTDEIKNI